jgi:hypothetical protein
MISKQADTKRSTRSESSAPTDTDYETINSNRTAAENRWRRTAEAAFYRAEARGFAPGRELDDWLEAERELEALEAARSGASEDTEPSSGGDATSSNEPVSAPRKRAASKRSRTTSKRSRTTRGAPMQARNQGDES